MFKNPGSQSKDIYSTWLEVDLEAIRSNIRRLAEISARPVMAVVKANAYGHGLVEVALAAGEAGAAWLGVARIEEAVALREAGIMTPILVLGYTPPESVPQAASLDISIALHDFGLAKCALERIRPTGLRVNVHIKVDTGMARLGVCPEEALQLTRWASQQPSFQVEGLFTHFARADELDAVSNSAQLRTFESVVGEVSAEGLRPRWVHAANSAATLFIPDARYDLVRPGIAIYGLDPAYPEAVLPQGFRIALTWKSILTSVKTFGPGQGVGYNHTYVTRAEERIGVTPAGYADGFRNNAPNRILVHGTKIPVVSRLCMDQTIFNLDAVPQARIGDEVILIGEQHGLRIRAEDLAAQWNTNNYEVICGLSARLPRIYLNQS